MSPDARIRAFAVIAFTSLIAGDGINFLVVGRRAYFEARYPHVDQAAWVPITLGFRF